MAGYRALFARALTWRWLIATATTRLAVCTVPLAVVFMAAEHTGSYAWGAVLAGGYAAGEAVGAPRMGARFQHRRLRPELSGVVVAEAIALAGVVGSLRAGVPLAAVVFAALGGGVASGTFGGLRTLLVQSAPTERESAMALDVIVNQVCQVAGPALAAGAAVVWSADWAVLVVSGGVLITLAVVPKLPKSLAEGPDDHLQHAVDSRRRGGSSLHVITTIWQSAVVVTLVLAMQAAVEVTLPSVVQQRGGAPAWAGVALSALAVSSIVGSFLYGLRRWTGRPLVHTLVLAALFGLIVASVGLVRSPVATVVLVAGAGFFQAAASTARSLTVTDALPASSWSVGFSVLYSCGAVGYTLASAASALFLATGDAATFLTALGIAASVVFVLIGWRERVGSRAASSLSRN